MTQASGEELLRQLAGAADVHVQSIDPVRKTALLIELGAALCRRESFLDDRILRPAMRGAWVPLQRLQDAASALTDALPLRFIFHTGHVGSTLVSRLLDETGAVFPLREPGVLRQVAEFHDALGAPQSPLDANEFAALLRALLPLWRRGDGAAKAVVLKATSSAGRIAPVLAADTRAIYLNVRAEPYLATLLAGENAALDLQGHRPERMRRLARLAGDVPPLQGLSPGEMAAMSWVTETWSQAKAVEALGERVLCVDFDALLGDVAGQMERIAEHLQIPHERGYGSKVAASATLTRYSKAPEHSYSPALRAQLLTQARQMHGAEIRKGLQWLERFGTANAKAAAVLRFSTTSA